MISFAHSTRLTSSRIANRPAGTAVAVVRPGASLMGFVS